MPFGFDLEEVIGIDEEKRIIEKRTSSKFDHIYDKIKKEIDADNHDWLKIGNLRNYATASSIKTGIKHRFSDKSIDAKIRKYDKSGQINFTVYVRYLFG
jgi:hypothetical protein